MKKLEKVKQQQNKKNNNKLINNCDLAVNDPPIFVRFLVIGV